MLKRSLIILAATAVPAVAQNAPAQKASSQKASSSTTHTADASMLWSSVRDNITQSAVDMPENLYSYRPTADVRTFGEMIGHIAGSQRMYCAIALGENPPAEDAVEKSAKTKAALVQAMKESNEYCARAYKQTDAATAAAAEIFGAKRTRLFALLGNVTHDSEHYGNIVTYMRMNKMVPPSSRPRSGGGF